MTSTQFNIGLTDNPRSSSRVLRPPGGGHTDIFGGEPEQPRGRRGQAVIAAAQLAEQQQKQTNGSVTEEAKQNGQVTQPEQQAAEPQTPPEPKTSPEPKSFTEPISTPEPRPEEKVDSPTKPRPQAQEPAKVEPPRRVRVPPGGFSSGLW